MNKYTFKVSDESKNSHGYKILTNGIDTTNFEKNPVMYFMHDRNLTVIGRWENLRKENNEMFADAVFDMEDPFAKEIAGKVERGFLKAASIGIMINELSKTDSNTVTKSELFEISIVDIGSNKNALRLYNNRELFKLQFNKQLKLNNMEELQQVAEALGLEETATLQDILTAIKDIMSKAEKTDQAEKETSKNMVNTAIKLGVLELNKKQDFLNLFKANFQSAKNTLQSLLDNAPKSNKDLYLKDFMKGINSTESTTSATDKPKGQWTLNDYRKHDPKTLKENPQLYRELIQKQYGE